VSYEPGQPGFPGQPSGFPPQGIPGGFGAAPAATPPPKRGKGLLGVAVAVVGLLGGGALLLVSGMTFASGAENLARAPLGCTTSLQFDETGEYFVFVETKGSIGELRGDCPGTDTDYEFDGDAGDVDVDVTLIDENDEEIDTDRDDSVSYDTGDFVGESILTFEIEEAGDVEVTVSASDDEVMVAIGKDPSAAAGPLGLAGIVVMALGVVLGVVLFLLGRRKKGPAAPMSQTGYPQPPMGYPPTQMPPTQMPPMGYPPQQPPTGPPGFPGQPPAGPGWQPPQQ
jgi:hypothetical protein